MVEESFSYSPLDEPDHSIRVLRVLPDLADNRIQVHIRHERVPTKYCCLSYMWSDPNDVREILLNGRAVTVRRNLYDFLHSARRRLPNQPLWIDALCINQGDNAEKSHQVQRMGKIYQDAIEVLVWLGVQPDLDYLFSFIREVVRTDPSTPPSFSALVSHQPERVDIGLRRLCSNAYWHRAWIAQEILLARNVRIMNGSGHAEWRTLIRVVKETRKYVPGKFNDVFHHSPMMKFWEEWPWNIMHTGVHVRKRSIWNLDWVWSSQCSDPRDRIYSLLALLDDDNFDVDYDEDPCSLFWRAGEHFRAWNGHIALSNLSQALDLNSRKLEENARLVSPNQVALTVAHVRYPDEWDVDASICEHCGTRLNMLARKDYSLCIQDPTENRASQHAILRPTPEGSFTVSLRRSYKTGFRTPPRVLDANSLQYFIDGKQVQLRGLPNWKNDVLGAEFRILIPPEFVIETLNALETAGSFLDKWIVKPEKVTDEGLKEFERRSWHDLYAAWEASSSHAETRKRKVINNHESK